MTNEKSVVDRAIALLTLGALVSIVVLLLVVAKQMGFIGNSPGSVRTSYDVFSSSTPSMLYASTTAELFSAGLENLHIDGRYTPASQDSVIYMLVEGSNDEGLTYYPISSKTVGTTDVKLYMEGASSTPGIPYLIPGDSTSVSGTMLSFMEDIDMVADHVRISIKETTTSTSGVVSVDVTMSTKE